MARTESSSGVRRHVLILGLGFVLGRLTYLFEFSKIFQDATTTFNDISQIIDLDQPTQLLSSTTDFLYSMGSSIGAYNATTIAGGNQSHLEQLCQDLTKKDRAGDDPTSGGATANGDTACDCPAVEGSPSSNTSGSIGVSASAVLIW